ncbi:hypothetical protein ACJIZ3_021752 [Penstemon smallii]|uniref:Transcription repressor n=1 Tax=Penstemon smallii TaxID=265156 RepID=A0ABD3SN08_9LAMI
MGKKLKFPFLFKASESTTTTAAAAAATWQWPTCANNPKTLSFRAPINDDIYKTINSAYLDDKNITPDSSFHRNHEEISQAGINPDDSDVIFEGLRSERLFFEPGETSSILEEAKSHNNFPYKESAAIMALDSNDPFVDFRVSMEEMVEAHGLKDWDCLEELLTCYLKVNGKKNHGYIVEAFVDLLLHLAFVDSVSSAIDVHCSASSSTTTTQLSFTSPLSFSSSTDSSTSPCLSNSLENEDGIVVIEKNVDVSCSSTGV